MQIEKICLNRRSWSNKVGLWTNIRASFQAAAASHAMRNLISSLCRIRILDRSILNFPAAINFNPAMNTFEAFKHNRTINQEIANYWERTSRSQVNWLLQVIDKGAASLASFAIDYHHASTANFFQAVAFPNNWGNFLAINRYRIFLYFHQGRNNVETWTIVYFELLRIRLIIRAVLAFDNKSDFFLFCHLFVLPITLSSL